MWTSHPSKPKNQNAALRQASNKLDRVIVLRSKSIFFQTKNGSNFSFSFFGESRRWPMSLLLKIYTKVNNSTTLQKKRSVQYYYLVSLFDVVGFWCSLFVLCREFKEFFFSRVNERIVKGRMRCAKTQIGQLSRKKIPHVIKIWCGFRQFWYNYFKLFIGSL